MHEQQFTTVLLHANSTIYSIPRPLWGAEGRLQQSPECACGPCFVADMSHTGFSKMYVFRQREELLTL